MAENRNFFVVVIQLVLIEDQNTKWQWKFVSCLTAQHFSG